MPCSDAASGQMILPKPSSVTLMVTSLTVSAKAEVMNNETRTLVKECAVSVWIKADFELLFQRVQRRSNRPLLKTPNPRQTLMDLIDKRYPTYAEADVTVVSKDVPQDQVAGEVIEAVLAHLKDSK